ncbi:signal peptidase II [Entomospira nematocerorum]|uniref:Lipoprotein signal peptidase n=1 Tax=Entomospira nematocerorum TaxID=2719987 RepID=A0A968GB55_9SPIO|nr:signal peptidase II [Entomospira nematocera]NIZ46640.1 signal peptidase II [Entomospira nematocera]WDI33562.1 signal peptidase II [Entomospira nematocera]
MQYKSATSRAPILSISIILSIILIDQLTKALIIRFIPYDPHSYPTPIFEWGGDFLRIIHVRNLGALFSLGSSWPALLNIIFLKIIPLLLLLYLMFLLVAPNTLYARVPRKLQWDLSFIQMLALSLAVGGGIGNMIDRILRSQGVVDFIDIKFYGIFGLDRWPTFNVADMAVVVAVALFILHEINSEIKKKKGDHRE